MAYASRSGRARTRSSNPQAFAVCQRCSMWYNKVDLMQQYDWRGASLANLYIWVCRDCYDTPQEQLRALVLSADPVPITYALPEPFAYDETNYQTITGPPTIDPNTGIPIPVTTTLLASDGGVALPDYLTDASGNILFDSDGRPLTSGDSPIPLPGDNLLTQETGAPYGLDQSAIMPLQGTVRYYVAVPVLSITANGTTTITVTCSRAHGLASFDQVSFEGLTDNRADGFYAVTVTTATAFTYMTDVAVPAGGLLDATSNIRTANVGLPYGFQAIPGR